MDLDSLQCFISLARYLNFTKAADKEHLTQHYLSSKINNLDQELGIQLFIRNSHQVILTDAGKEFFYDTEKYLEAYYIAIRKAQNIHSGYRNSLKIGVGLYEQDLLSPFLYEFSRLHTDIEFNCYQYGYLELAKRFEQGLLDIILTSDKYFCDIDLNGSIVHLIHASPWVIAISSRDPLSKVPLLTRNSLENQTMVTMSEGNISDLIDHFKALGALKSIAYVNTFHTKMLMIDSCLGVGTIPRFVNTNGYPNIKKLDFEANYCPRLFYILCRKGTQNTSAHIFVKEYMAALPHITNPVQKREEI